MRVTISKSLCLPLYLTFHLFRGIYSAPFGNTTEKSTLTTIETISQKGENGQTANYQFSKNSIVCGVPQPMPKARVVGGNHSRFGAWPWMVSVRRKSTSTHRCGGALLNNQWIATAAHCVDDMLITQISVRVGEYDFTSTLEPYPHIDREVKQKLVHPLYQSYTYENDLALIQLNEPVDYQAHIRPICLPPKNMIFLGQNATITGWGRLNEGGVKPNVLQEVRVPILSNDKCIEMFLTVGRKESIPQIFICSGYDKGGSDACLGDSGGPLQIKQNGKWFLAGIISWGIGCGQPSYPGVNIRITEYREWILNTLEYPYIETPVYRKSSVY